MKVLVTGGTEGIGLAFAKYYAAREAELYLVARNMLKLIDTKKLLEDTYHTKVNIYAIDLSIEGASKKLYESLKDKNIDVVMNNAGIGYTQCSWKIDIEKEEKMVMLNCVALLSLSKLFVRDMLQRKNGCIINISSTGCFQPGPYIAGYYASKAFVTSYTKALYEEVRQYGIKVYCVAPGPVYTNFYEKSGVKAPKHAMHVDQVVDYTIHHMHDKCMIIPGFWNRMALFVPEKLRIYFVKKSKQKKLSDIIIP